jgi:hypothetical protein
MRSDGPDCGLALGTKVRAGGEPNAAASLRDEPENRAAVRAVSNLGFTR